MTLQRYFVYLACSCWSLVVSISLSLDLGRIMIYDQISHKLIPFGPPISPGDHI